MKRRCLLLSYAFAPSIGGIETVSRTLADSLTARGHDIRVVTATPSNAPNDESTRQYAVIRNPNSSQLWRQLQWCDIVLQSNFSLRLNWPLVVGAVTRPWVLVHHTLLTQPDGELRLRDRLKRQMLKRARCYAVSNFLSSISPQPCEILPNPYDSSVFKPFPGASRVRPLLFAGRLVTAKGMDILLHALALLKSQAFKPDLSVVGEGPEKVVLQSLTGSLGLTQQVTFLGSHSGQDLARLMSEHQILVVPSRTSPPECLPMICLEAIGCGCAVIAARQGGLPEATGPCGITFESGSPVDLAQKIKLLLESPQRRAEMTSQRESFLEGFASDQVINRYEQAMETAIQALPRNSIQDAVAAKGR